MATSSSTPIFTPPPIGPLSFAPGSSSSLPACSDDPADDVCSICLESFASSDPATVTTCKHEYHLQCILEWAQRSKECPICWQSLVLMDSASQKLLVAVQLERSSRPRWSASARPVLHGHETQYEPPYTGGSELSDRILQRVAAAMSRAQYVGRSQRQSPLEPGSSEMPNRRQMHTSSPEECHSPNVSTGYTSPSSSTSPMSVSPTTPAINQSHETDFSREDHYIVRPFSSQSLPNEGQQRPRPSEMFAFSGSLKSKLSAASARYKNSFSKGTQEFKENFKEKFSINNSSVKELSKGVQREMSAGIAGLSKMIDRLEIKSKCSSQIFNDAQRPFDIFSKGKQVQEDVACDPPSRDFQMESAQGLRLDKPSLSTCSNQNPQGVSRAKDEN